MRTFRVTVVGLVAALSVTSAVQAQGLRGVGSGPSTQFLSDLPSYQINRTLGTNVDFTSIGRFLERPTGPGGVPLNAPMAISLQRGGWEPVRLGGIAPGQGLSPVLTLRFRSIDSLQFEKRARFATLRETTMALAQRIRESGDASLNQLSVNFRHFMFPFPLLDQPALGYGFFSRTDLVGGGAVSPEAFLAPFTAEMQQSLGDQRFLDLAQVLLAGRQPPAGMQIDQFYDTQLAALGNYLFNAGRYVQAAQVWGLLAQRDPASALAHRALALGLVASREMRRAAAEARRSLTLGAGWPDRLKIVGSNFQDVFPASRDLEEVRAELEAQLAKQPDDPDLGFLAAFLDLFQGRWPAAEERLARLADKDEVARNLLALLKGGAVSETVHKPVATALRRVADELTGLEEPALSPEARARLIAALQTGGATYEDQMRLGDFRFFMGDFTQAGESYRAAHKERPQDAFALFALTHACVANGEYRQAARYLDQALALEPTWGLYEFRLQEFYGDIVEYERNLKDLERQVELRPRQAEFKFLLAYVYYFSGRYADATDLLAEVLRLDPRFQRADYFLRLARLQG